MPPREDAKEGIRTVEVEIEMQDSNDNEDDRPGDFEGPNATTASNSDGKSTTKVSLETEKPSIKKNGRRKRHGARNQHRHKFFVKWIIETFDFLSKPPSDQNSPPSHILDVAGGKGEVAARLCMCHGQQVVMVDPRTADVVHCFETLVLPKIPNKWQVRLEEQRAQNPTFVTETLQSRFQQLVTTFDDHRLTESEELDAMVQESSLILGLHADGATEAIVTAALKYDKPFVVVPCCVFPNLFRDRRVWDEETKQMVAVRSHEQFCRYLLSKDSRFRLDTLPFEGRNVAIWWDGK